MLESQNFQDLLNSLKKDKEKKESSIDMQFKNLSTQLKTLEKDLEPVNY